METPAVYKAIAAVQKELAGVGVKKNQENKFDHYKFRGIDDIYNAMAPVLANNGLCILPRMLSRECIERVSDKGKTLFYITVDAEYDFVAAKDGSLHTVKVFGEAMDRSDKATNKAMSAAYKYACFQTFCIPTEGDNDTENNSHTVKPKTQPGTGSKKTKKEKPEPEEKDEFMDKMREFYKTLGKETFVKGLATYETTLAKLEKIKTNKAKDELLAAMDFFEKMRTYETNLDEGMFLECLKDKKVEEYTQVKDAKVRAGLLEAMAFFAEKMK